MKRARPALMALLATVATSPAADPNYLTIKAVKSAASRCTIPPCIQTITGADRWHERRGPTWNGENDWEVFFTMSADQRDAPLPRLALVCPGVTVQRVVIGHTDVKFTPDAERLVFDAVPDRSVGTLINNTLPDPEGDGLPIGLYHNWRIRADGPFAGKPYPEAETRAVHNYLLAAREALRLMGGMGPKDKRAFDGYISLLSFEVACGRGHNDSPPHVHIMLYVPAYSPGSQVPHFYMDESGRIVRNSFTELGVSGSRRAGNYGPGDVCQMYDTHGNLGLECVITKDGGLILRKKAGADEYLLSGDEQAGPAERVCVLSKGTRLVACTSHDDAAQGVMTATVERFQDGSPVSSITQTMRYDPFTGRVAGITTVPPPK
ncbi:MAG TPA: hypothetical protein PLU30_17865 [Verrucomicrobiae bacterium]|nr:hypothetical protein [Verrucomicrobiae bacterium]